MKIVNLQEFAIFRYKEENRFYAVARIDSENQDLDILKGVYVFRKENQHDWLLSEKYDIKIPLKRKDLTELIIAEWRPLGHID